MSPRRVLVVDDDDGTRKTVGRVLQRAGYEVSLAGTVASALALLGQVFDAAVLDVGLPDGEGFEIVTHLRQGPSPCAAVVLTGTPDGVVVQRSIGAGVTEFLAKPCGNAELLRAVDAAVVLTQSYRERLQAAKPGSPGDCPPSPGATRRRASGSDGSPPAPALEMGLGSAEASHVARALATEGGLTDREQQTLELVLVGASNPQIARQLDISPNTVKYHVKNMLSKLGLESRSDLLRHIVERGRQ